MTKQEFEALLEEAFIEGYNAVLEEVFEEDNSFDLEEEMDSYLESNKETKERNRNTFMKNTTPYGSGATARRGKDSHQYRLYDNKGRQWSGSKPHDDIPDEIRHAYLKRAILSAKKHGESALSKIDLAAAPSKSYPKYKELYDRLASKAIK